MNMMDTKRSYWTIAFIVVIAVTALVATGLIGVRERQVQWDEPEVTRRLNNEAWKKYLADSPAASQQSQGGVDGHRTQRRIFLGNEIARMMADHQFRQGKFTTLPQSIQAGLMEAIAHWGDTTGQNAPDPLPQDAKVELIRTGKGQLALIVTTGMQRFAVQTAEY